MSQIDQPQSGGVVKRGVSSSGQVGGGPTRLRAVVSAPCWDDGPSRATHGSRRDQHKWWTARLGPTWVLSQWEVVSPDNTGAVASHALLPNAEPFRRRWESVQVGFVDDPPVRRLNRRGDFRTAGTGQVVCCGRYPRSLQRKSAGAGCACFLQGLVDRPGQVAQVVVVGRAVDRERDDHAGAGEVIVQDPGAEGLAFVVPEVAGRAGRFVARRRARSRAGQRRWCGRWACRWPWTPGTRAGAAGGRAGAVPGRGRGPRWSCRPVS